MPRKLHFEVVPLSEIPSVSHDTGRPAILVVDDEPVVAETLAKILSNAGFAARAVHNAKMALRAAREMRPEFLLTDVQMPGINGVDLAVQVADEFPACEILLFSGHATGVDMESARRAGHDFRLMEKPIHPDHLLRYISGCLEGERGSNGSAESPDVWMWGMMPSRAN